MYDLFGCTEGDHSFVSCDCPDCMKWADEEDRVQVCTDCELEY